MVIDPFKPGAPAIATDQLEPINGNGELPQFADARREFETRLLQKALEQSQFHQGKAARLLGLSYHQFRGLYRKYNLG